MKIISKVNIHIFFYIFSLIMLFSGLLKDYVFIILIIIIHEIGHLLAANFFKWDIDEIILLPFGALTKFNTLINTPLKEELLVTLFGPLFQTLTFLIPNYKLVYYSKMLLLFNLLPIVPLDGSKILNVLLNKIMSFKTSYILTNVISLLVLILLFLNTSGLIGVITCFLLLFNIIKQIRLTRYIFHKFLFERYLYKFNFKKVKFIKKITSMKKDYQHVILKDDKYYKEFDFLREKFDK